MNKNDERILELKKYIKEQKEQLKSVSAYAYKTNKIIEFGGVKHNLNVIQKETIYEILIELGSKLSGMEVLSKNYGFDLASEYLISGYAVSDWMSDLTYQLVKLSIKDKENSLKQAEIQLDKLLSEDKKTELMLDELSKTLGI